MKRDKTHSAHQKWGGGREKKGKKSLSAWRGHLHFFQCLQSAPAGNTSAWITAVSLLVDAAVSAPLYEREGIQGFANYRRGPAQHQCCQMVWYCKCSISTVLAGLVGAKSFPCGIRLWPVPPDDSRWKLVWGSFQSVMSPPFPGSKA